jgi:hypothetical protein
LFIVYCLVGSETHPFLPSANLVGKNSVEIAASVRLLAEKNFANFHRLVLDLIDYLFA